MAIYYKKHAFPYNKTQYLFVFNIEACQTTCHNIKHNPLCYRLWNKLYPFLFFSQVQPFWPRFVSLHALIGLSPTQ